MEGLGKSLKAKGVFDAYDKASDPWGETLRKSSQDVCSKKGVMVMNC